MNVFVDSIVFFLQKSGGISTYWNELLGRALKDPEVCVQINYAISCSGNLYSKDLIGSGVETCLPKLRRYLDFVNPISNGIVHSTYYRIPVVKNECKVITTVHDFTYERYRHGTAAKIHSWQKRRAIINSDGVICVSHSTRRDLKYFLGDLVDMRKVVVIHNGVGDMFFRTAIPQPEWISRLGKYILFVGDRSGYKNFAVCYQALQELKDFNLVCVGRPFSSNEIRLLDFYIPGRYYCHTGVSNEMLNILYNFSYALLYPSLYEGFGIPLLEAMKAGCPVITTDSSSIPEVTNGSAIVLHTMVPDSIRDAIVSLGNESTRNDQVAKGIENAERFSWDKTYSRTREYYKQIMEA